MLAEITDSEATAEGYRALVQFADEQPGLRAWAVDGTGGHGAGLARHLAHRGKLVVELDRPERAKRRNRAKSDPLDAVRAAREALSRPRLGTPRTTGERQALSVLLAARHSAAETARIAQQQIFSLVIAAPEQLRCKLRGQRTPAMVRGASRLRVRAEWDLETRATAAVLRGLRRAQVRPRANRRVSLLPRRRRGGHVARRAKPVITLRLAPSNVAAMRNSSIGRVCGIVSCIVWASLSDPLQGLAPVYLHRAGPPYLVFLRARNGSV